MIECNKMKTGQQPSFLGSCQNGIQSFQFLNRILQKKLNCKVEAKCEYSSLVASQNKHSQTPQQILKINKSSELKPWHQIWQKLPIQQMTMQQIFIACSFVTLFPFMRNTFVGTFAIGYFCGQFPLFCRRLTCSDQAHGDRIYNQAVSNGSL